eukprot:24463-Hanusia_phi.AAC.2
MFLILLPPSLSHFLQLAILCWSSATRTRSRWRERRRKRQEGLTAWLAQVSEPWRAFLANAKKRERVTIVESRRIPPDFNQRPPAPNMKYLNDHDDEDIVPCEFVL